MSDTTPPISNRKANHLDLCTDGDVGFRSKTNLLEDVGLIHNALPELSLDEVDLSCSFAGKPLRAPLMIAAMTGGVDRAERINRDLASVAEELGIGFALGSQRPLLTDGITAGYLVRDVAPNALILGNLGVVQAGQHSTDRIAQLVEETGVDALCIHLNPAMELVQPEGDKDFRGAIDTIARLTAELPVPLVVKETGCGLSRHVGEQLVKLGVAWVDVSGAGGTSWVGVESYRGNDQQQRLAQRLWDWGIPTGASVAQLSGLTLGICATGGVSDGLAVTRALALGATCGGIARPFLQTHARGGRQALLTHAQEVIDEIRRALLLTGSRTVKDLQKKRLILGPELSRWVPSDSPLSRRLGT